MVPAYRSATPYEEGVRRTVAWMDQHGKIAPVESDPLEDRLVAAWERFSNEAVMNLSPPA